MLALPAQLLQRRRPVAVTAFAAEQAAALFGVDIFAQQIVFGVVLILAVAITIDRSKIPIVK